MKKDNTDISELLTPILPPPPSKPPSMLPEHKATYEVYRKLLRLLRVGPVAMLLLAGCAAATSTHIVSPTGESWIGVECRSRSQVACYAEAGDQCPGGYDILGEDQHQATEGRMVASPGWASASVRDVHYGDMIIRCHGKSKAELDAEYASSHPSQPMKTIHSR